MRLAVFFGFKRRTGTKKRLSRVSVPCLAMDREVLLLQLLQSQGPATALDLSKAMGTSREETNRLLYRLRQESKISKDVGFPPLWSSMNVSPKVPEVQAGDPRMLVLIDLGNTHDCLKPLFPYAASGLLEVRAYADLAYNGFGITPPLKSQPGVTVLKATTADKNAADVQMIWDLAEILTSPESPLYFVVVATKDQGFRSLKPLAEARGHRLEFATCWPDLRNYVE